MTESTRSPSRPDKAPVSTRTLLTCVAIGIGCSLLNVPGAYVAATTGVAFPPALLSIAGLQILSSIIALRLLARGGVGIFTSAVVGFIGVIASSWGWGAMSIVGFGVIVELPFLIGGYRRWTRWRYLVAALLAAVFYTSSLFTFLDFPSMPMWMQVVCLVLPTLSMLLFCRLGVLAADGLRRAGVGPKTRVQAEGEA